MTGYWFRHRFFLSLVITVLLAVVTAALFAFPSINQNAINYNSQSMYQNTEIDFIAPEPSIEQVNALPGTNGIDTVFPFYLTRTKISVNGDTCTTTVLLSDQMQNLDSTMYNNQRLIKKANKDYENPIYVDWTFCQETSSDIGDIVTISVGEDTIEYQISAIYESNTVYENGAILAPITTVQRDAINANSQNTGYSGMYVMASDYNACRSYLLNDYRPLGRLKDRDVFDSDEQYDIHYNAIMSANYANEITDFRVRENDLSIKDNPIMVVIGIVIALIAPIAINTGLRNRGCERVYFAKNSIPRGQNVKPYYNHTFLFNAIIFVIVYLGTLFVRYKMATNYIPFSAFSILVLLVPAALLVAEIINLISNYAFVSKMTRLAKKAAK